MRFVKAETNGNDFVIVSKSDADNINIRKISDRKKGIGADQIIIFEQLRNIYRVTFFNSDGSQAEMCGNGLCALSKYINQSQISYLIGNKIYTGYVDQKSSDVSIIVPMPKEITIDFVNKNCKVIDTGNKHIICLQKNPKILEKIDEFNIHFINIMNENSIQIETYERGAGKTLSCGSGAIAAAFAYGEKSKTTYIYHDGGESYVSFSQNSAIFSASPNIVFEGVIYEIEK